MMGAMQGEKALPTQWLRVLELRDTISTIATDLSTFGEWDVGQDAPVEESDKIWARYPGW